MALDLFSPLKVVSWASAHADCPMRYTINSPKEMVIVFGSGINEFEFSLDAGALHTLVQLGVEALNKMDTAAEDLRGRRHTPATAHQPTIRTLSPEPRPHRLPRSSNANGEQHGHG